MKSRVAILYICTGKYSVLWEGFYQSFQKFFLKNSIVEYFVFTDAKKIPYEEEKNVHKYYQKNLGWPNNTLRRFDIFLRIEDILKDFQYVYFINANMRCVRPITEENFLPLKDEENLVVVQHAGYYQKKVTEYPYERNPQSLAYVPIERAKYYVMGSLNGGKSNCYMEMVRKLSINTDKDWENGIVALWHDESHLNRYILDRKDVKILPPSYCAAEELEYPFEPYMILLDKSKIFDVEAAKTSGVKGRIKLLRQRAKEHIKKLIKK